ncbi:hypothetical protein AB7M56_008860 [Bradyrhizobium elkanii]|jgi:hypothetical protein|nr:hypothetical protein [Bradyrhizobium elkanii]MCS3522030.1 hypothetical protein [Bradyrhizobium elkanii]MCS4069684.1 hypothetical protein [Bradyrhizobium elkanii]MCS4076315.1 hypothetical protein [Bradyrhizobium elkanii]MCS4103559.1 hypothetical protein [Bradyrhizobium elkanii]
MIVVFKAERSPLKRRTVATGCAGQVGQYRLLKAADI